MINLWKKNNRIEANISKKIEFNSWFPHLLPLQRYKLNTKYIYSEHKKAHIVWASSCCVFILRTTARSIAVSFCSDIIIFISVKNWPQFLLFSPTASSKTLKIEFTLWGGKNYIDKSWAVYKNCDILPHILINLICTGISFIAIHSR